MNGLLRCSAGLLIGYVATTLIDSLYHRYIQHAARERVFRWRRARWLYGLLLRACYAHRVHHARAALHARRSSTGRRSLRSIRRELDALGARQFEWPVIAALILVCAVIYALLGTPALLGALVPASLHPWATAWLHPYLHLSAFDTAASGRLTSWLLRRHGLRAIARYHRRHHHNPRTRFNLLPGADRVIGLQRSRHQ